MKPVPFQRLAPRLAVFLLGVSVCAPAAQAQVSGGFPLEPLFEARGPYQHAVLGSSFVEPNGTVLASSQATLNLPDGATPAFAMLTWQGSGTADPSFTFRLPDGTTHTITADPAQDCLSVSYGEPGVPGPYWWSCFLEVTDKLAALASLDGTYRASGLTADTGPEYQAEAGGCTDTCEWSFDEVCDDGGENSVFSVCPLGSDCFDCGPRPANVAGHVFAGAWSLSVLYVDPADLYPRSVQIAIGLFGNQFVGGEASEPNQFAPFRVGPEGGRLTVVAMEGDLEYPFAGDCVPAAELPVNVARSALDPDPECDFVVLCDGPCLTPANQTGPVLNAGNPSGNLYNETVSTFEAGVVTGVTQTNGLDIDTFHLGTLGLPVQREIPDLRVGMQTGGDLVFQTVLVVEVTDFDADGDGLSNLEELDITFTDPNVADSDGDGLSDGVEVNGGNPLDPRSNPTDPNVADTDGDGLCDGAIDVVAGTTPCVGGEDRNGNGLLDPGETNANEADSDADGLDDGTEVLTGNYGNGSTDPLISDTDGDGILDGAEDVNGDGSRAETETDPTVFDTDGDGIGDGTEQLGGAPGSANNRITEALNPDTDQDGLCDGSLASTFAGVTCSPGEDVNNNGRWDADETDATASDTDQDGLSDGVEVLTGAYGNGETDPLVADTDGDGLRDGEEDTNANGSFEAGLGETDPTLVDTDGGGESDGSERANGRNPVDFPADDNGALDDDDQDGLDNGTEVTIGTDPNNPDTDGDGIRDGIEVNGVTRTNPLDPDTDNDGLCDGALGTTYNGETCGAGEDLDNDGVFDPADGETNPTLADTDNGGESDGSERANGRNPVDNPLDDNGLADDDDNDGLDNRTEGTLGTDPNNPDSDQDGVPDGTEVNGSYQNGGSNPLDPDTDGDGIPDGEEDANRDGDVDAGESDPTVFDAPPPDDAGQPADAGAVEDGGPIVDPGDAGLGEPAEPKPTPEPGLVAGSAAYTGCASVAPQTTLSLFALCLLGWRRRRR